MLMMSKRDGTNLVYQAFGLSHEQYLQAEIYQVPVTNKIQYLIGCTSFDMIIFWHGKLCLIVNKVIQKD